MSRRCPLLLTVQLSCRDDYGSLAQLVGRCFLILVNYFALQLVRHCLPVHLAGAVFVVGYTCGPLYSAMTLANARGSLQMSATRRVTKSSAGYRLSVQTLGFLVACFVVHVHGDVN